MLQNIIVYEIQSTDTLESIATNIGMSSRELLDFHNEHCSRVGLLWITGLAGITKIVIPKNYKSVAQIRKAITDALPPPNLSSDFFAEKYESTESFIDFHRKKIQITYDIDIDFPQNQNAAKDSMVISADAKDFKKNGIKPDDKMSELGLACMKTITPFAFEVSPKGKILGINDFKNLEKTFAKKKEDLKDFFIGEISDKYIDRFENHLKNETHFLHQYSTNLLHQALFPNLEWFYNQKPWEGKFYLLRNSFPVLMQFETTHQHLDEEKIQTIIKGKSIDDGSLQDLLSGRRFGDASAEPLNATSSLMYTTNKSTKQLLELQVEVLLCFENEIFKEHHLKIIKS